MQPTKEKIAIKEEATEMNNDTDDSKSSPLVGNQILLNRGIADVHYGTIYRERALAFRSINHHKCTIMVTIQSNLGKVSYQVTWTNPVLPKPTQQEINNILMATGLKLSKKRKQ